MGIQGLLPQLKPIQNPVSLNRYEGKVLGIDGYAWLHRAAYSCSHDLVMGNPTDKYLQFFIKKISMLKTFKIEPYFIFDGGSISVKKRTEDKRREKRIENKAIAERLWKSGEKRNAMEYFQKCVDVTPEMAKCVIDYCKINRIKYIVAPFEADSQMVYLEKKGFINGIISEDSDLLVFGCRKLITKLNDFGECIEISADDFSSLPRKFPLGDLSPEEIRAMVYLSGCDYTAGIPKIGLLTAMKLVQKFRNMDRILLHLQREGKYKVPCDFSHEYELASYSFQYQRVFCPQLLQVVPLNDIPTSLLENPVTAEKISKCIGCVISKETKERVMLVESKMIDHTTHARIALGDLNPYNINQPLLNREHKLQLISKSEIITNRPNIPTARIKSIDSFFANSQKTLIPPTNMGNQLERRFMATNNYHVQTTDKISRLIKKRSLTDTSGFMEKTSSTSRFFKSLSYCAKTTIDTNNNANTNTNSITNIETENISVKPRPSLQARQVSSIEDGIETEIPESMVSTQIPSSFVIENNEKYTNMSNEVANKERESDIEGNESVDDSTEILSEVEDNHDFLDQEIKDNVAIPELKCNSGTSKARFCKQEDMVTQSKVQYKNNDSQRSRRILGCKNPLAKFAYLAHETNTPASHRKPLAEQSPNKRLKMDDSVIIANKNNSIRRNNALIISNPVGNLQRKVNPVPRNNIQLTISRSSSATSNNSPLDKTRDNESNRENVQFRPAKRSVSLLSQFVYRGG